MTRCCFLVLIPGRLEVWHSGHGWRPGGAFCFRREIWNQNPFRDIEKSEDSYFLHDIKPNLVRICDVEQYMVVRHGSNTWRTITWQGVRMTAEEYFSRHSVYVKGLGELVPAEDAAFYRRLLRA